MTEGLASLSSPETFERVGVTSVFLHSRCIRSLHLWSVQPEPLRHLGRAELVRTIENAMSDKTGAVLLSASKYSASCLAYHCADIFETGNSNRLSAKNSVVATGASLTVLASNHAADLCSRSTWHWGDAVAANAHPESVGDEKPRAFASIEYRKGWMTLRESQRFNVQARDSDQPEARP